jgi:predicted phosphodiesterase
MTTVAVLADIHGNLPALDAVLDDLRTFEVDHIVVAGDVVNWGPWSREVMERLAAFAPAVIRGNNEFYLLDYNTPRAPAAWSDLEQWRLLPWLARTLRGRWHTVIAAWPDRLSLQFPDAPPVLVVHGSPRSNNEPIYDTTPPDLLEAMFAGVTEQTVVAAHTHIAMDRKVAGWHVLNPGTVGVPLQGRPESSYMIMRGDERGWTAEHRVVPFDLERVLDAFRAQDFVEECGAIGQLVVDEFATSRLHTVPFLRWREAQCPDAPLDLALVERFRAVDARPYTPEAYILP